MKKLQLLILLLLTSCVSYVNYVTVNNRIDIPNGVKSIILTNTDLNQLKETFKDNGISVQSVEDGFNTEEILLDEGTRAMYKIRQFDNEIRITAFWGITEKLKSDLILYWGYRAASAYDVNTWNMVIYNRRALRSKSVFDYLYQIVSEKHKDLIKK